MPRPATDLPVIGPYLRLFMTSGPAAFVAAGFTARAAHIVTTLGIVFLIAETTGSYGVAGLVSAAYAFTYALVSPVLSRLVDQYRQGRMLLASAVVNTCLRGLFLGAACARGPSWLLCGLSVLVGGTMPAVGAMVRARWRHLIHNSGALNTALSFESITEDLIVVIGPVLISAVVQVLGAVAAMALIALGSLAGLFALALQRGTEPTVARRDRADRGTALVMPGVSALMLVFVGVGAADSTINVATIAFTTERGAAILSGGVLAMLGLGSIVSGCWYGTRVWRWTSERRLMFSLVLYTAVLVPFVVVTSIWLLFLAVFLAGLAGAPIFTSGYLVVNKRVPKRLLTEGITILSAGTGIGIALGSAIDGKIVDQWDAHAAFAVSVCCAAIAMLAGLLLTVRTRSQKTPQMDDEP